MLFIWYLGVKLELNTNILVKHCVLMYMFFGNDQCVCLLEHVC